MAPPEPGATLPRPRGSPAAWSLLAWPAAAVVALAFLGNLTEVRSVDLFWHLAAGRWILDHRVLPGLDPFRFTATAEPWVDHEWGFQVLLALADRVAGLAGVVVLRAGLLAAVAALVLGTLRRRGVPLALAAGLAALALLGLRSRLLDRPELVSLLATSALLAGLPRYRARPGAGAAAPLVLLTAAWASFHPGVLAAPAIAALYLGGAWWSDRRRPAEGLDLGPGPRLGLAAALALPAALAVAILANPWGLDLYRVPGRIAAALADLPATNPDWAPFWVNPQPFLAAALAGLLALALVALRRLGRIDLAGVAVVAGLIPLVASSVRHQGLLWLAGTLLAGELLGALARAGKLSPRWGEPRRTALSGGLVAATAALLLAAPLVLPGARDRPGLGVAAGLFPAGGVQALATFEPVGHLFNSPAFGGYLLWRLHPPRQIFLDTRNEVNPGLLRELARARSDSRDWEALLVRHQIDGALLGYDERPRPLTVPAADPARPPSVSYHTASALLFTPDRFALVHWDDVSMLFLARTPARAARLAGSEYGAVQPEDWRATLARAAGDPAFHAAVRADLARKLAEEPGCRRARRLLSTLDGGR